MDQPSLRGCTALQEISEGMSRTMALWEADLMENSRPEYERISRVKINSVKNYETESHWKRTDLHFWEILL